MTKIKQINEEESTESLATIDVRKALIPNEILVWKERANTEEGDMFTYTILCCTTEDWWKSCTWIPSIYEQGTE